MLNSEDKHQRQNENGKSHPNEGLCSLILGNTLQRSRIKQLNSKPMVDDKGINLEAIV